MRERLYFRLGCVGAHCLVGGELAHLPRALQIASGEQRVWGGQVDVDDAGPESLSDGVDLRPDADGVHEDRRVLRVILQRSRKSVADPVAVGLPVQRLTSGL